jgi:hypothetical protein
VEIRDDGYLTAKHGCIVELIGVPIPAVEENKREAEDEDEGLWQSSAINQELLADSGTYSYMAEMGHYVLAIAYSRRLRCGDGWCAALENRTNRSSLSVGKKWK